MVPGSTAIYTSANDPGLIYDTLAISPESLNAAPEEWAKVREVWYRIVAFIENPETRDEALEIMAARVGVSAAPASRLAVLSTSLRTLYPPPFCLGLGIG